MNEKQVAARYEHAAQTLRRLKNLTNREIPQSVRAAWPDIMRSFFEAYGWQKARYNNQLPSARDITMLDEVLDWSMKVSAADRRILWERAFGVRWKTIEDRLGCKRTHAWQLWVLALLRVSMLSICKDSEQIREHISSEHCEQNVV